MANFTDINSRPGKGSRLHRNVSNPAYRSGHEAIFGRRGLPEKFAYVCPSCARKGVAHDNVLENDFKSCDCCVGR